MTLATDYARAEEAKRGEIWDVELDPTKGSEINKTRRVVIISSSELNRLPVRLGVPVTGWKPSHENNLRCLTIKPSVQNGLEKKSTVDVLQTRCLSIERFIEKKGCLSAEVMEELVAALAAIVEYT